MSEGIGEARPEAEGQLALARLALDDGELGHAAAHIGNAIADDPSFGDAYVALDTLAARADGALSLFPMEGKLYIGAVAARSYLLARAGSYDEAFGLLCSVAATEPGKPWSAGWLAPPWLADDENPVSTFAERLSPREAAESLMTFGRELPDPAPPELAAPLAPFLEVARYIVARSPADAPFLPLLSSLARRLGAHDEAIAWCERAERATGSSGAAIMLGYALRSAGRLDEMHDAWVRALDRDRGNTYLRTDIAESLAARGRVREGLEWLEQGLAIEPDHPKAFPSACEMRYQLDGDIGHLVALADWWREHPEHDYAHAMLAKACDGRPWLGLVPWGSEAVVNVMRQVVRREAESGQGGGLAKLTLSALEVPSAMAVLRSRVPGVHVTGPEPGQDPPTPGPSILEPVAEGRYRLWVYAGCEAMAVPPVPSAAAVERLREAAAEGYPPHPVAAYDFSVPLSGLGTGDLLGLMAHPVPAPDTPGWRDMEHVDPTYWRRVAQAWACLGLLHHEADQPWESSTRRQVLVDLLNGVEDWATDAAMNALVVAAWADPAIRADVRSLVGTRFTIAARASLERAVTIVGPMAHLALATPGMPDGVRLLADDVLRAEADADADAP